MKGPLYKTTIVIWSKYDATMVQLDTLGQDATEGEAYCSSATTARIEHPELDPDWDGTEFFPDVEEVDPADAQENEHDERTRMEGPYDDYDEG